MYNPVTTQLMSKAENQQRARQLVHIQQINLAAKNRAKPKRFSILKLLAANVTQRLSSLRTIKVDPSQAKLSVEQK